MKTRSKLLSGLMMGAIMIVSFGGGLAYAGDGVYTEADETASTTVEYKVESTYTVSIPQVVEFENTASGSTEEIAVGDCNLLTDETVDISINTEGIRAFDRSYGVVLGDEEEKGVLLWSKITKDGNDIEFWNSNPSKSKPILTVDNDTTEDAKKATLSFAKPVLIDGEVLSAESTIPAGSYYGTLNFVIEADVLQ